jgi:hypothetical protein
VDPTDSPTSCLRAGGSGVPALLLTGTLNATNPVENAMAVACGL